MKYKVSIISENVSFEIKPSQTILEASMAAGIDIPFGCGYGGCGSCIAKIISGQVFCNDYQQSAMTDLQKAHGYTLCCKSYVSSDIELDID